MLKARVLAQGEPSGVVDAGVHIAVEHGDAVAVDQRGDGAEVGEVAGGEDDCGFRADEVGQRFFQFEVDRAGAVEQARAGHRGTPAIKRGVGGGEHLGVAGQAEVVVGAEHDHALAVDLGFRSVVDFDGLEEGVEARGAGLVGELEVGNAGEDVGAVRVALAAVHLLHIQAGGLGEVG